jgi:small subunit ribosomal protein S1
MKNLTKEDGSTAKLEEKLEFKVLEFNKNTKRIVLSHSKLFEDVKREEAAEEVAKEKEGEDTTQKAVKKLKANLEKTTLGDISELAALKSEMESKDSSK